MLDSIRRPDSAAPGTKQRDGNSTAATERQQQHCSCFSGLTADQARLLELAGALRAVEWQVHEAASGTDDPALRASLERFLAALVRVTEGCRARAWRKVTP